MFSVKTLSLLLFACFFSVVFACNRVKEKTKETIHKSGETVGKASTKFFGGVGEGIEKTLDIKIEVAEHLKNKGLSLGKNYVRDSGENKVNLLTLYIIFEKDFNDTLKIKAFDRDGFEIGRVKKHIQGKKEEAAYFDIIFDPRTKLESRGKIRLE
jgi:hypothetical protein